jgi:site-specific recombinase XerD
MARNPKSKRKRAPKTILKLPDLEQSKSAVLNSLRSPSSQRSYDHAIREFIDWYCSEPRLAFNKTVVTRYRISLEQRQYAPSTINLRLAAVRRLAYEASDCGLLSPDLAAGIRRVKGARRLGVRIGNWLTVEEGRRLVSAFGASTPKERRNRAMVAVLIGCGLRLLVRERYAGTDGSGCSTTGETLGGSSMKDTTSFPVLLESFFTKRLIAQRRASPHTIGFYRDTFRLLLQFAEQRLGKETSRLTLEDLQAPFLGAFLDNLESARANTTRSRNLRLAAIRSFFRYIALEVPQFSGLIQRVIAIPNKRLRRPLVGFLTRPEIDALLHYWRFQTEIRGWVAAIMRSSSPLFRQVSASPRSLRFFDRTSASVRERIFDVKGRGARNDVLLWPNLLSSC